MDPVKKVITFKNKPFLWVCFTILFFNFFFVSGLWQSQTLRSNAIANGKAINTPNNSTVSSTFTIHTLPAIYINFSEDWYIYFIRSKRLITQGFPADVMDHDANGKKDYRELVQVAICSIPAFFGQKAQNLAIIYMFYLTVVALLIYWSVLRIVPKPNWGLIITLVVILSMFFSGRKIYRISTVEFGLPFLLVIISAIYRVLINNEKVAKKELWILGTFLFLLSGLEIWSFCLCMCAAGIVLLYALWQKRVSFVQIVCVFLPATLLFLIPTLIASSPDLMIRAGMSKVGASSSYKWLFPMSFVLPAIASLAILALTKMYKLLFTLVAWLIGIVVSGMVFMNMLHMNAYELFHFNMYNTSVCCFILGIAFAIKMDNNTYVQGIYGQLKIKLHKLSPGISSTALISVVFCVLIVACFTRFNFINYINKKNWQNLGYTSDVENVNNYFKTHQPDAHKSILVLSYEYNYQLAYNTNMNMLLPSGFSLHSTLSTNAILTRMQIISKILDINVKAWDDFLLGMPLKGETIIMSDRILSLRYWYTYYLLHRTPNGKAILLDKIKEGYNGPATLPDFIVCEEVFRDLKAKLPIGYRPVYTSGATTVYQKI